jgi:predicted Mrr-cat superfamily restriction endonuclease
MPLNGKLLMKQAKIYKIEGDYEYSTSWLQKFRKRHSIEFLKICSDKTFADQKEAKKSIVKCQGHH